MTTDLRAEIRKILDDYSHAKYLESEENGDVVHREDYINPFLDLFEQYAGEQVKEFGLFLARSLQDGSVVPLDKKDADKAEIVFALLKKFASDWVKGALAAKKINLTLEEVQSLNPRTKEKHER